MSRMIRRWVAVASGVVLAGVLAGAVVASQMDDGTDLAAAIGDARLNKVAEIAQADGSAGRGVYVQTTSTGHLCVWEAATATSRERGGGCNTADDPLNGRSLTFTLSYDGGPAVTDVTRATLFGLAASEVARASVLMSDGTDREIRLRKAKVEGQEYSAFGYRFRNADLRRGVGPVAVVAIGTDGKQIDSQPTGIGG